MIPSSTGSSIDPVESAPANSIVSQPTERSIEGQNLSKFQWKERNR